MSVDGGDYDADATKPRQNDCQSQSQLNAYSQDVDDDNNDDISNPATPITSVRTVVVIVVSMERARLWLHSGKQ